MVLPVWRMRVTEPPGSPKAARLGSPSWLDGRLVLGVLLVLVSVLVGAKVLAGADSSQQVWVGTHDLAPGTVLTAADLQVGKVRLFGTGHFYLAGHKPLGYVVLRGVGADELVPRAALDDPTRAGERRDITVPVAAGHLPPDLARGDLVDVYVTLTTRRSVPGRDPLPGSCSRVSRSPGSCGPEGSGPAARTSRWS
jgi:hypothetical protein